MAVLSLSSVARNEALRAINEHKLPESFIRVVEEFYLPVAYELTQPLSSELSFVGIQGSQGSGKSTCADFISLLIQYQFGKRAVVMSIDDFYLTKSQRQQMSSDVHSLFVTRGVPGTHDVGLLESVLDSARAGRNFRIPVFDKSIDDRAPEKSWQNIDSKVDFLILEGWCVGVLAESDAKLGAPINDLEAFEDSDGGWRQHVNFELKEHYSPIFEQLDSLIALQAPSFDCVYDWRLLQEQKMIARLKSNGQDISGAQSPEQIRRFISHYQRLTDHALKTMPDYADYVFELNADHSYNQLIVRS